MTQATFEDRLRAASSDPGISNEPPAPDGFMAVAFNLRPTSHGVRLSIKIGQSRPRRFDFAHEGEAVEFIERIVADVSTGAAGDVC